MKILDRYMLRNFLISYLIMAFVMIGLYVLVDLALNSDEFAENKAGAAAVMADIASYYGHQVFVYFQQLSGVITLVSAIVALTIMNRRNEMTAILASGVSLYRVIWPAILLAVAFNVVTLLDQEVLIPRIADKLVRKQDEVSTLKRFPVQFYQLFGAWSEHDRFVVADVHKTGGGQAVLRAADALGGNDAVGQVRPGDLLAVRVGGTDAVRVYVQAAEDQPGAGGGLAVAPADPKLLNRADLPPAASADPAVAGPGDMVVPIDAPMYLVYADQFDPGSKWFEMQNVDIFKIHCRTYESLWWIRSGLLTWSKDDQAWQIPPRTGQTEATMMPLTRASADSPVAHRLDPAPCPIRKIFTATDPQKVVLRHSSRHWMQFMSTLDLQALGSERTEEGEAARPIMHVRFTQPIINMILLLLGVPFVLTRAPFSLAQGILKCVLLAGSCFVLSFVFQQISGDAEHLAVVAAWLPVLIFGPLAVLMLDAVKT